MSVRLFVGFLLLLTLATGAFLSIRYYREQAAIKAFKELGGQVSIGRGRPWMGRWSARLGLTDHVALVNLGNPQIKDGDLSHLDGLDVVILFAETTGITDAGLARLRRYRHLEALNLSYTRVTDAGMVHVGELQNLVMLDLNDTEITDAGLAHLKQLKNLRTLGLLRAPVTDDGIADLRRALPGLKVSTAPKDPANHEATK